eukprot:scaffold203622_cov21-Prasinocladus_malaysianus.AAC.1
MSMCRRRPVISLHSQLKSPSSLALQRSTHVPALEWLRLPIMPCAKMDVEGFVPLASSATEPVVGF